MSVAFSDMSGSQLLELNSEQLNDAIRLEAIKQGAAPPIALSDRVRSSEWLGFQVPAEYAKVWRLRAGYNASQIGYMSEARAIEAMQGAVFLEVNGYPREVTRITDKEMSVECVMINVTSPVQAAVKFEEALSGESEEFIKIRDACLAKFGEARQAAYDRQVNSEKRAEYLRLANGDETIAKAFWAKVERGEFPAE